MQANLRVIRNQVIGNPRISILQVKEWMGHADIDMTMKYLHFAPRAGDADLIAEAFASVASDPRLPHPAGGRTSS